MTEKQEIENDEFIENTRFIVDKKQNLLRIDRFLNDKLPKISRTKINLAIKTENILVNQQPVKPNYKVKPDDKISIILRKEKEDFTVIPENIPLNIIYEDDHLMVINKPAGLVVHPGNGNKNGTLANAILFHNQDIPNKDDQIDRPGIIHRIDKLTSGLLLVGKTEFALNHLAKQFFNRTIDRKYIALVWGTPSEKTGRIEGNIGRNFKNRRLMNVFKDGDFGKYAVTNYTVLEQYLYVSLVECKLETGRTHQIRVHFKHIGHPLFGDFEYGGDKILKGTTYAKYKQFVDNCLKIMPRQSLHAKSIGFIHPDTNKYMFFESELPEDFKTVIEKWKTYTKFRDE